MMTQRVMVRGLLAAAVLMAGQVTAASIEHAKKRQEQRIENGEKSGRLSPSEAERLEKRENAINQEEQAMRQANGGKLTKGERHVVRKQQKGLSHRIYKQKHDQNNR